VAAGWFLGAGGRGPRVRRVEVGPPDAVPRGPAMPIEPVDDAL
jgi:hypothetical protein